jgi:hypothetical protein
MTEHICWYPATQPIFNNTLVTDPKGSTMLITRSVNGHDPKPVQSNTYPHNIFYSHFLLNFIK